MRIFTRFLFLGALAYLGVLLLLEGRKFYLDDALVQADPMKPFVYFGGVLIVGLIMATVISLSLVPAIGDAIGNIFEAPNQPLERDPRSIAQAKVAQGDYQGAMEIYVDIYEQNPRDSHAVCEIAHLYCDRLGQPENAISVLEQSLDCEHGQEEIATITTRLSEIHWKHFHDAERARNLLIHIAETMPETKYAANAMHRLHEIDRELAKEDTGFSRPG
jgi:tetratricopeptide (TPR) repeat protein